MRQIKVLQMIDSLHAGGAEMVAVNLANELSKNEQVVSYLVSSRVGGMLVQRISPGVRHFVLNKKRATDVRALWRLYRFIKKERIDIVHAHSTSFYFPVLLKRFCRFKLVWHDHYGKQVNLENGKRDNPIKTFAPYFDFSFAVNKHLLETDQRFFGIPENKIMFLPNFSNVDKGLDNTNSSPTELKGNRWERVVCLANFRPQKDHLNLLRAFQLVHTLKPTSYLYLVGKGSGDACEREVLEAIDALGISSHVKWLGGLAYPAEILSRCGIGVLSSESEGLPLAIIEYGLSGLAVVATAVGEVPGMLTDGKNALLVPPKNAEALAAALLTVLNNKSKAAELQQNLATLIADKYSAGAVMKQVLDVYYKLLKRDA
jgi:glycosyltransferase involved in cell wall biosynthesis